MSESPFKTFMRGSVISLLGTGILGLLNYFVRRTLSIQLSEIDYGIFYSTFALLSLIYGFGDLGMTQSATTLIAKYAGTPKQGSLFSALFLFRLGVTTIATVAVLGGSGFLSEHYLKTSLHAPLLILAGMLFFQSMGSCFRSLWIGLKQFGTMQIIQVLGVVLLLLGVLAVGRGGNLTLICLVFFIATAITTIGSALYEFWRGRIAWSFKVDKSSWGELLGLGGGLAFSSTLFTSLYYMDTVMLTSLEGVESSAMYNVALPIMQIMQSAMVFPAVMLPVAMDMTKRMDFRGLRKFTILALLATLLAAPFCYLFFHWSAAWLIGVLFSVKYVAAAPAVPLLCTASLFFTLGNFLLQILICQGKTGLIALIAGICFGSNFLLNFFLIRHFGFTGAAAATLCSYVIFVLAAAGILMIIFRKKINQ